MLNGYNLRLVFGKELFFYLEINELCQVNKKLAYYEKDKKLCTKKRILKEIMNNFMPIYLTC